MEELKKWIESQLEVAQRQITSAQQINNVNHLHHFNGRKAAFENILVKLIEIKNHNL